MSNKNCIICSANLCAVSLLDNGTVYNCNDCGRYFINDDDKFYFEGIADEIKRWYASRLRETKGIRQPTICDLSKLIPSSPQPWFIISRIGHNPTVVIFSIDESGKCDWKQTPYDKNLHG